MPNIVVCYKWVLDEADIRIGAGGVPALEQAGRKISEYDRNAIEEATLLSEKHGGTITAITLGGPEIKSSAKDALSRGPSEAILIADPALVGADSRVTANALAAAVKTVSGWQLLITGEGSSDIYAQQTGPRLAALLGVPCISFVNKLDVTDTGIVAERKLEDGVEVVEASFPVVVTVLPDINKPRIPGLKQVMGAAKKPQKMVDAAALGLGPDAIAATVESRPLAAPTSARKQVRVENVADLAQHIVRAIG